MKKVFALIFLASFVHVAVVQAQSLTTSSDPEFQRVSNCVDEMVKEARDKHEVNRVSSITCPTPGTREVQNKACVEIPVGYEVEDASSVRANQILRSGEDYLVTVAFSPAAVGLANSGRMLACVRVSCNGSQVYQVRIVAPIRRQIGQDQLQKFALACATKKSQLRQESDSQEGRIAR